MRTSPLLVSLLLLLVPIHAQTPPDKTGVTQVGPVNVTWQKGFTYAAGILTLTGNVNVVSQTFGLTGQTVTLEFAFARGKATAPGASGLRRATAVGTPNRPVTGHFEQVSLARSYTMQADKMVFVPAPATSKAETGTLELTGNVVLTIRDPAALDGPAVSKFGHLIMHLGPGPDFPTLSGDAGSLQLTPLQ